MSPQQLKFVRLTFLVLLLSTNALAKSLSEDGAKARYDGYKVVRIPYSAETSLSVLTEALENVVEDFWKIDPIRRIVEVVVAPEEMNTLENVLSQSGLKNTSVIIENLQYLIDLESQSGLSDMNKSSVEGGHNMTWDSYHSFEDIKGYMEYLAKTYPDVSLENIGKSYEGRDMLVLKICKKGKCGSKPAMWIDATAHAREWVSPAVCTFLIKQLVETNNEESQQLVDKLDWYFLPMYNPDGYEFTRSQIRLWRKNRSDNGGMCKGVDLNRNWGYHFDEGGSSSNKCFPTYQGPSGFSEIENRNVRDYLLTIKDQLKYYKTLHAFSQLILIPWSHSEEPIPTYSKMKKLIDTANEALKAVHQKDYITGSVTDVLYVASGSSMDWVYGELGVPYSIAIELRDDGYYGFLLPPKQIIPNGEEIWAFTVSAAKQIIDEFQ